jgi:hypothetical protein
MQRGGVRRCMLEHSPLYRAARKELARWASLATSPTAGVAEGETKGMSLRNKIIINSNTILYLISGRYFITILLQ